MVRSRILFVLFVAMLLLFSFALEANQEMAPRLVLERTAYDLNEPIAIGIGGNLSDLTNYTLRIQHDGSEYSYNGDLGPSVTFHAPGEGIFTILLQERVSRLTVDQATITVIDPGLIEALDDAAYSNRLIVTDKSVYGLGETVAITINYRTGFSLRILSPTTVYRFLGDPGRDVRFVPSENGSHEIQLVVDGHVVETKRFMIDSTILSESTSGTNGAQEFLPHTNIRYAVADAHGRKVLATTVIRKDGHVIQSSIDPMQRYELDLAPANLRIDHIRLNGLRFGSNLSLGLEEVDPTKNFRGKGAVYAFAIDPSLLDFVNGSITLVAPAEQLYKCAQYDFKTRTCMGEQILVAQVEPGTSITISLSPADPLYTFVTTSLGCSCQYTQTPAANSGTVSCNKYCNLSINGPGSTALTGYISSVTYNVTITVTPDGCTITNGNHEGDFDHDSTQSNGDEVNIGTSTATTTTSLSWTQSGFNSTGTSSFSDSDCNGWPSSCTNYYAYLAASAAFQAPGKSTKNPAINITLTGISVTWNYTERGNLSVTLNSPPNLAYRNTTYISFNYTPNSISTIQNCSLYTNASTWGIKNSTTAVTNGSPNYIGYAFPSDGAYLWNVWCNDSSANSVFAPANFTVYIDTTPPTINLMAPSEASVQNQSVVNFTYNVTDVNTIANCSLLINGTVVSTDTSVTKDAQQDMLYGLASGLYSWSIGCYDIAGNWNLSETRNLTVNVSPVVWNNTWFESYAADCAATGACLINLRQQTDGGINTRTMTLTGGGFTNLLNATSDYIGGNGAFIAAGSTVDFNAYFSSETGAGTPYLTWKLYVLSTNGTETSICQFGDDLGGGAAIVSGAVSSGSCTATSNLLLSSTDQLKLVMNVKNTHNTQSTTFTHDWDVQNSNVTITTLQTIGTFTLSLVQPNQSLTIAQGETFNLTCEATCDYGYCINTTVWAQYNTSSAVWTNISSSGNLILGAGETNPHSLGNLTGNPETGQNTTFVINGSQTSINNVRCYATTRFSSMSTSTQQITVGDSSAPNVSLVAPPNGTYTPNLTLNLTYYVNDTSGLSNCSLYINGTFNQTNQTAITNPGNNRFLVVFPAGSNDFNWTVSCTDTGGLTGNASQTWNVHIDSVAPNISLTYPGPAEELSSNSVNFNWTAYDNRGENLTCRLYIDGALNKTGLSATPGLSLNWTVSGFAVGMHNWSVNCSDLAGNSNISETRTFNITDTPPTVSLYSPGNNSFDADGTLVLEYNASDNNGFENCSLYFDGLFNTTNTTPVLTNQINNFTLTGVPDGRHYWTVNCTDTGGFSSQPAIYYLTVDTVAPNVSIVAPNGTQLTSGSINLQFSFIDSWSPNGSCTLQYNTTSTTTIVANVIALNNSVTTEPETGVLDNMYSWNVTCRDLANNTGITGLAPFNVSQVPTITPGSPAPNAYANGALVNFTFTPTDNDGFRNCTLKLNGPSGSNTTNTSPIVNGALNSIVLTGLASGSYTWQVNCTDNGTFSNTQQTSLRLLIIDNQAPNVTLNYPLDEQVNYSYVNFNWTADDDVDGTLSCDLWIDGRLNLSALPSSDGIATNRTVAGFRNGLHNWTVNCTDDAGNWNMSNWTNFTIYVPPIVNLSFPPNGSFLNYYTDVTLEYIPIGNSNISNCTLYIDGQQNETNTTTIAEGTYNYFFINFTAADQGRHNWSVACTDVDNLTGTSINKTFTIDLYPPNITLTAPGANTTVSWNNVTFNFTVNDTYSPNATCNLSVEGYIERENITVNISQPYTTGILYPDANYSWNVTCVDLAGNWNYSETWNFTVYAPPRVTPIAPPNYSYQNTTSVTVTYLPQDAYAIGICNLTVDGGWYTASDNAIDTNDNNSFVIPGLSEGLHNWTVICRDSDGNINTSVPWYFTVDLYPPNITLYTPENDSNITISSAAFNFTANDSIDQNVTCNLTVDAAVRATNVPIINGSPYTTTLSAFLDGIHTWNVTCADDVPNRNTSVTWQFNTSVVPTVTLVNPPDQNWTNSSAITFSFNASDNDGFRNCTLLLNGSRSTVNTTIVNNATNYITNSTMTEGSYNWSVNCTDNGTHFNNYVPSGLQLFVDRNAPNITLLAPASGTNQTSTVVFNYTVIDNMAPTVNCTLVLDNSSVSNDTIANGGYRNISITDLAFGIHYWNVTCIDLAGNRNLSETWNFTIPRPDLTITAGNITFNTSSPIENENLTVNATIFNIGQSAAGGFIVQFWTGVPGAGGVQLGTNQYVSGLADGMNITLSQNYTAVIGLNQLFVIIDSGNNVSEEIETNNNASNSFIVGFYEVFSGTTNNELRVANANYTPVWTWNMSNATGSNILVADVDSGINFRSLHALGMNLSNASSFGDFASLDTKLNATNHSDNVNRTWTSSGAPIATASYMVFSRTIANVPVVNSTNTTAFRTGILWDTSDGGVTYNGSQDVVFITQINMTQSGALGTYDYELRVPAPLRDYVGTTRSVVFYTELR